MKLHQSNIAGLNIFTAYGEGYVAVNHQKYEKNLIVLPESMTEDWTTAKVDSLTEADMARLLTLGTEIAQMLIKAGADVNAASDNGTTPLIAAARGGHMQIVKALLAAKADVAKATENGETAVDVALKNKNTDIADLLRQAGGRSGQSVTLELR